jgi:tetratricopeptide (TPR) repeat protein
VARPFVGPIASPVRGPEGDPPVFGPAESTSEQSRLSGAAHSALDRFDETWRRGERPDLAAYLPPEDPARPAERLEALYELAHIDLEYRLKAGESARVEDYLGRFEQMRGATDRLLDLIAWECELRRRSGPVARAEYLARFPELEDELRGRLETASDEAAQPDATPPEPAPEPTLPNPFGRYRVLKRIGGGGMGDVYLVHDPYLERDVALKVPRLPNPAIGRRFIQEARVAATLHHPNICPVYEAGEVDGRPYLTMPHIKGQRLDKALPPPLPAARAVGLVRVLALALAEAHRHGVVHRDLKPGNVMLNDRGEPILTDFGLAVRLDPGAARSTLPGTVLGTRPYMSPEQAAGRVSQVGPLSDVYSLGATLYQLLTGRLPFASGEDLLQRIQTDVPTPPRHWLPELDPQLEEICLRTLAKRPEDRYPSMTAFAQALAAWLGEAGAPAETPPPAAPDPRAADDGLPLLRQWGWERGLELLNQEIRESKDPSRQATLRLLVGWLAGERGRYDEARRHLRELAVWPRLAGWALAEEALMALREKDHEAARGLLRRAAAAADAADKALNAALAHGRGTLALQQGRRDQALGEMCTALEVLGPDHFATGRVLDTLGTVHAAGNNFPLAEAFYAQALALKRRFHDDAGVSLTHGQLGRLYLAWGRLEKADEQFRKGIEVARRTGDERGEAQLYNHRGQVRLGQGQPGEAAALLDEAVRSAHQRFPVVEGFACKDRALAHLALGELDAADEMSEQAERLFAGRGFDEGTAHAEQVRGLLRRAQGRHDDSVRCLRAAAARFERCGEQAEAARCLWEAARSLRTAGAVGAAVEALLAALDRAEEAGRGGLAALVEAELREVAPLEQARREVRRLGGAPEGTAAEEMATVLCCELWLGPGDDDAPAAQLELRRHLWAMLERVLREHEVATVQYQGGELLGLARGAEHARRAVEGAAAAARAVDELNRPRRVLNWPLWELRAAVSTGLVCVAPVGTFRRADHTAAGRAARLAAALVAEAQPGRPCVSETTYRQVAPFFAVGEGGPRRVVLARLGPQQVWDLVDPADS